MNLNAIYQQTIIFAEVERLEAEITAIETLAIRLSDHSLKTSNLKLTVDFESKEKKQVLNSEGDLIQAEDDSKPQFISAYQMLFGESTQRKKPKEPDHKIEQELSDSEIFLVLSVLIKSKQEKRRELLTRIKDIYEFHNRKV